MIIFQAGDVFAGRFRLDKRIGQGGMGQVWRATQLGLQREVALKLILPAVLDDVRFREMFLLEAQVSARLAHPNIVPVVDFGEHEGGVLWLVQIFVQGQDLGHVIAAAPGGLPAALAIHVTTQILLGLQAAHDSGVVHRDLKPGNVLVSHAGDVLITDFGIAKVISADATPSISTVLKGSPGYLAPELLRGQPARFSSDLFSVGAIAYELLTGRHPFIKGPGADRDQIFYATLNDPIPAIEVDLPPGVDAVVRRLLERDPARRYQTATQVLDDLARIPLRDGGPLALRRHLTATRATVIAAEPAPGSLAVSGMAGQMASSPSASRVAPTQPGRRRRLATLTAVVAAAAAAVAVALATRGGPTGGPRSAASPSPAAVASAPPDAGVPPPPPAPVAVVPDAAVPDASPAPAAKRRDGRSHGDWIVPGSSNPDTIKVR